MDSVIIFISLLISCYFRHVIDMYKDMNKYNRTCFVDQQMNMMTGEFHAIPLSGHDNPIAVDYDPLNKKVYWTDVATKVIKRANLNGSEEQLIKLLPIGGYI